MPDKHVTPIFTDSRKIPDFSTECSRFYKLNHSISNRCTGFISPFFPMPVLAHLIFSDACPGTLESHVDQELASQPALELITITDGAKDNWIFLEEAFPNSTKILDFYHAAEHLKSAIDTIYKNKKEAIEIFEEQRSILRHDTGGIDRIIAFLEEDLKGGPENSDLMREIQYFKKNRHRCRYQTEAENGNPIGSGVVESACKSLVAKRLKCSGMAWRWEGEQAILNFRSYLKSGLFDRLWNVIAKSYSNPVFSAAAS